MTKDFITLYCRSHSHLLQSWWTHYLLISATACSLTATNLALTLEDTFVYVNVWLATRGVVIGCWLATRGVVIGCWLATRGVVIGCWDSSYWFPVTYLAHRYTNERHEESSDQHISTNSRWVLLFSISAYTTSIFLKACICQIIASGHRQGRAYFHKVKSHRFRVRAFLQFRQIIPFAYSVPMGI